MRRNQNKVAMVQTALEIVDQVYKPTGRLGTALVIGRTALMFF